jgi:hypothetical protein
MRMLGRADGVVGEDRRRAIGADTWQERLGPDISRRLAEGFMDFQ